MKITPTFLFERLHKNNENRKHCIIIIFLNPFGCLILKVDAVYTSIRMNTRYYTAFISSEMNMKIPNVFYI